MNRWHPIRSLVIVKVLLIIGWMLSLWGAFILGQRFERERMYDWLDGEWAAIQDFHETLVYEWDVEPLERFGENRKPLQKH